MINQLPVHGMISRCAGSFFDKGGVKKYSGHMLNILQ